ncbi:MAG: DUF3015 family protein [Nitrospirota bacterium]
MRRFPVVAALLVSFSLVTGSAALAAGYGAAGCGFGGMLIKENKILPQIGAWLLNGVLGNQTFGITSGTSECGAKKAVLAQQEQQIFTENNFNGLAKEMAVGEGEYLNTLAGLLGCPAEQTGSFGSFTKEHYETIFPSNDTDPQAMLITLKRELAKDPGLSTSCNRV